MDQTNTLPENKPVPSEASEFDAMRENKSGHQKRLLRREFLGLSWLISLSLLGWRFINITLKSLIPVNTAGQSKIFVIGPVVDLPTPDMEPVNYSAGKFWLTHTPQGVKALYKVCPHLDCLVNWDSQTETFVCPCHGSVFLKDGTYQDGPAPRSLDSFVVQLVDAEGRIITETESRLGEPLPIPVIVESQEEDASETAQPELTLVVDTSRLISGQLMQSPEKTPAE